MRKPSSDILDPEAAAQTIQNAYRSYKLREVIHPRVVWKELEVKIPDDLVGETMSFVNDQTLEGLTRDFRKFAYERDHNRWLAKVAQIERLFRKYDVLGQTRGGFILLPGGDAAISSTGVDQELWVTVMGNNPSFFKLDRYCPAGAPGAYKEIEVRGVVVGMCPDLPVDMFSQVRDGNYDKKFQDELNRIYQNAGLATRFRDQRYDEYFYADTQGGEVNRRGEVCYKPDNYRPKLEEHALLDPGHTDFLGKYTPYREISGQSPSGDHQPRSIAQNAPNSLGFRRSGVWEWVSENMIIGGSWRQAPMFSASSYQFIANSHREALGPSRLVKIAKTIIEGRLKGGALLVRYEFD